MERYTQTVWTGAHAEPLARDTLSTIAMVVLESGHYYQVRITPRTLERCWDLEAVDPMLPRGMGLPDGPTTLLLGQTLTAIVSCMTGAWHPGHALYCLWRWAQRRWQHYN